MNEKDNKDGILKEEDGILTLDTRVWMRPKNACDYLNKRGFNVSPSLMYYWRIEGKIESKEIESLGGLAVVNIETAPKEMRVSHKVKLRNIKKEQDED